MCKDKSHRCAGNANGYFVLPLGKTQMCMTNCHYLWTWDDMLWKGRPAPKVQIGGVINTFGHDLYIFCTMGILFYSLSILLQQSITNLVHSFQHYSIICSNHLCVLVFSLPTVDACVFTSLVERLWSVLPPFLSRGWDSNLLGPSEGGCLITNYY